MPLSRTYRGDCECLRSCYLFMLKSVTAFGGFRLGGYRALAVADKAPVPMRSYVHTILHTHLTSRRNTCYSPDSKTFAAHSPHSAQFS